MSEFATYNYSGNSIGASPVLYDAQTVLYPILTIKNDQLYPTLQSIDMTTGEVNWVFSAGTNFQCTPAVNGQTIYIGNNDGNLYAVNATDGTQLWSLQLGGKLQLATVFDPGSGLVFTGDFDGHFYAVDPVAKALKWQYTYNPALEDCTELSPAVVVGNTVYTGIGINNLAAPEAGFVYAFDITTGAVQWSQNIGSAVSAPMGAGDGLVFVSCYDNTFRALDQTTGAEQWRFTMNRMALGQPAYANGWVYAGSTDGNFYAHASHPPALTTAEYVVAVNDSVPSGVVLNGNTAFFGGMDADGGGYFYALDITTIGKPNSTPTALTEELAGQLLFVPTVAFNQVAFCAQGFFGGQLWTIDVDLIGTASADALTTPLQAPPPPARAVLDPTVTAGMLNMAQFTSQLIVDEYDVSGTTATPTTPAFQMLLNLYDENMAPQTSSKVSLWASEPVTMTSGGQSYPISTDSSSPTILPASVAGQLTLTIPGSIGLANLFVQPDFFLPGFYLSLYPDTDNMNTLMNLQAPDLDPSTALGYDGQAILLSNFQDETSRTNIASAISNTVGRQPAQTTLATMASLTADVPSRSYQPGAVPSFTVDFSSGISFSPNNTTQIADAFGVNGEKFWIADSFLDFDDFINNIVNGVEKIGSIVWQFANDVAGVIVNGAENVYHFVVQTVDDAIQVAVGIFKQVVADISKVVEWLSYLFSWQDIVNTHVTIKNQVLTTISNFQSWIDSELKMTTNDLDAWFNSREQDAVSLFDQIIKQLGSQSVSGMQQVGGNPNTAFTAGGSDVTTQANWLPRKLSENAAGGTLPPPPSGLTGDTTTPLTSIENFFTSIATQITNDPLLQSLPSDITTALKALAQLFTGNGFLEQTLADVLAVVRDLVAGLIHLGKVAADAFLQLLQDIIDGIVSFLTAPIQIPFLSDFYQLIAGDQLSVISLISLIAAIPTTIVYKLLYNTAPPTGDALTATLTPLQEVFGLANTFLLLLLVPLWISADLAEFPAVLTGAITGATALQAALVLTLMAMTNSGSVPDYELWVFQFVSVVLSAYGVWAGQAWAAIGPPIYGGYGFGMIMIYILFASLEPDKYWSPDGEPFFNNVCSSLPYLGQPLIFIQVEGVGPAAVALIDAVGYGTSAALSTIMFWEEA